MARWLVDCADGVDWYGDVGLDRIGDRKVCDMADEVNHPPHYTSHPSGIECIQIVEHMSFNLGNALKYIWRCDLKRDAIEDLQKQSGISSERF